VLLGESRETNQFGILGSILDKKIAIDLDGVNTISLFGVQGGGKSYTIGTLSEMASMSIPQLNLLTHPLATVILHYHEGEDYEPEFVTMNEANDKEDELQLLQERYGAKAKSLDDVLMLVPQGKLSKRREEFPHLQVEPIAFHSQELDIRSWKFLMGAVGNQSLYVNQINAIMRRMRGQMSLEELKQRVEESGLNRMQKDLALDRLFLAEEFINDNTRLGDYLKPGRLIIVDLRDEYITQDQALGLFVSMIYTFAGVKEYEGKRLNKLFVFDEAHKYMGNKELTQEIVQLIRQMRHSGTSVLIASQDPPSLPTEIIELSSMVLLHKFNSPNWLKHIQKSIIALQSLTPEQMTVLQAGEAYVWASKASDHHFTEKAVKITCRPRVTKHGGGTKRATDS
jgi:DNA phosphorothioation-dependent restriction protein DptH